MWNPAIFTLQLSIEADRRAPARRLAWASFLGLLMLLPGKLASDAFAADSGQAIDPQLAGRYFQEAEALSRQDAGRLWGVPLYGLILFVDPETHAVVANQAGEYLQESQGVFAGKLPPEMGVANTAVTWAGAEWTMVMWPLPEDRQPRLRLLMHECFHRIQAKLGLPGRDAVNNHLDSLEGRIWLEMEWRALEHALWEGPSVDGRRAIEDALYFRSFRRSLVAGAAANENALELNEGLAEYTGVKLSTASMAEFAMVADLKLREAPDGSPNFVRSFAYTSGPAYGYLLDTRSPNWRRSLTPQSDLGQLLAEACQINLAAPDRAEATRRAQAYDGDEVIAQETARARERQEKVNAAKHRFVDGPVLILPVDGQFNYSFNPNAVLALDGDSTVYDGEVQVSDVWGVLKSSNGFLMVRQNGPIVRVQVPAPADPNSRPLKGDGWSLEVGTGWTVSAASRAGDFTLKKAP